MISSLRELTLRRLAATGVRSREKPPVKKAPPMPAPADAPAETICGSCFHGGR